MVVEQDQILRADQLAAVMVEIQPFREAWAALGELESGKYTFRSINGGLCWGRPEVMRFLVFGPRGESSYLLAPPDTLVGGKARLSPRFTRSLEKWARPHLVDNQEAYGQSAREILRGEKIWTVGMILTKDWENRESACIFYPTALANVPVVPGVMRSPVMLSLYLLKQFNPNHDKPISVNGFRRLPSR